MPIIFDGKDERLEITNVRSPCGQCVDGMIEHKDGSVSACPRCDGTGVATVSLPPRRVVGKRKGTTALLVALMASACTPPQYSTVPPCAKGCLPPYPAYEVQAPSPPEPNLAAERGAVSLRQGEMAVCH